MGHPSFRVLKIMFRCFKYFKSLNFHCNTYELDERIRDQEIWKAEVLLGIEVVYLAHGILITQQNYVIDLLMEIRKSGCKPTSTPNGPTSKGRTYSGQRNVPKASRKDNTSSSHSTKHSILNKCN